MSQHSLYDLTIQTWADSEKERKAINDIFAETPSVIEAHKLEEELKDRFEQPIEDFQQGLISSTEFLKKLVHLASIPSDRTEIIEEA